ncbi:HlyD family type I secretion periplasmic adaptor subunit [uncultured Cohaesibacter sp.]|uniref:HlyD family type I secretion periplasmic adaptor subunit n=1 Tax=uncultured Cohaesibacter sp. TaxID=1002546 RepID=UPI0029C93DF0|nr:HlyD family type I secretion periplasmic adaptor subunit [uncultured Cohaesibacter sp.]
MAEISPVSRSIRRHLVAGLLVGILLLVGVGFWATSFSLAGAVVSNGVFVVDTHVKMVQHPTGGVVGDILVKEGDLVSAGKVLIRLDATQTRAQLAIVIKRLDELNARLARLEAERDDKLEITFPASLRARINDPNVKATIGSEARLFSFRREVREGKKAQLRERIAQYGHEIEGFKAQEVAYTRGLAVLEKEIATLRLLFDKGLVNMQRLNSLEAEATTFEAERGEKIAYQAQIAGKITETKLQILSIDQELRTEVGSELREVQAQIGEFVERKVAAEDQLKRIDIIAPQSGFVHELATHTVGGVISPADVIMQIVPESDRLVLEVQISPQDIDQITLGQPALLRLSAFNRSTTPELNGFVSRIAADLTRDEHTGLSWYLVRISIPPEELAQLSDLALSPGMPSESFIRTEKRTALSYLLKPLVDQFNRAFREE